MTDGLSAMHEGTETAFLNSSPSYRLNLGCGEHLLPAPWLNIDRQIPNPPPENSLRCDLDHEEDLQWLRSQLGDYSCTQFLLSHIYEHIRNPLALFETLWHLAKPNAKALIRCPHGANDEAWEDPTHIRPLFPRSFTYLGQPTYHRANYGYRGDWHTQLVLLEVDEEICSLPIEQMRIVLDTQRNIVREMAVILHVVKPARLPQAALQSPFPVQCVPNLAAFLNSMGDF